MSRQDDLAFAIDKSKRLNKAIDELPNDESKGLVLSTMIEFALDRYVAQFGKLPLMRDYTVSQRKSEAVSVSSQSSGAGEPST